MSWIQKLYETYEQCKGHEPEGAERLLPVSHTFQQAHVEITLDAQGNFKAARTLGKEETVIPATEKSAGRTGKAPPPHPLCDKVQYCAGDYTEMGGGKPSFFKDYETQLAAWCASAHSHPKAEAILAYVRKKQVVADLVAENVLHVGSDGKLLNNWGGDTPAPEVFKVLTPDAKTKLRDQGNVFIRWRVLEPDNPCSAVWEDESLQSAWASYDASAKATPGVCMVTGDTGVNLALSHPKRIRHAGDGAKLISANDSSGYTFRGRFTDDTGQQACGVGYEVTQKAHNALRWLIQRQAYRNGDQAIVSWAVGGAPIPDPFGSSLTLLLAGGDASEPSAVIADTDAGQAFAKRLNLAMKGYRARLGPTDDIVVMGLDSATPGRMAITFYRELTGSEFLARIERWHTDFAWHQNFGKDKHFVGAPAPRDIAEAGYATRIGTTGELRVDEKFLKTVVERLLPCIVDGQPIPKDIASCVIRKASNRVGLKHWEWEKFLGVACGLYRGAFKNEGYEMALETDRRSRDYLYGRLLALAENIENYALTKAESGRETTAARFMQRFADRPASTWRTIELALSPYKSRLNSSDKGKGFLIKRMRVVDEILCLFEPEDFLRDSKLSGEFLLGYHCQRQVLNPPKPEAAPAADEATPAE
jgi:CRISPR-associated protein Csd1